MATEAGLAPYIDNTVTVLTSDGRHIIGTLKGFDQLTNLILDDSHERVYREDAGVETIVLGLYVVRGDNIAVIGEVDEDKDSHIDLSKIRALPLKPVLH